jgi:organic radical activating enzyme
MNDELVKTGRALPIAEEFYSIQGEGYHTGKASYFIRIGGCDVGCEWCDTKQAWDAGLFEAVDTDRIVGNITANSSKAVVVTGGEPLLYNLDYLCRELKKSGISTFLETSGKEKLTGIWDWICLSPKRKHLPKEEIYNRADELKIIVSEIRDIEFGEDESGKVGRDCILYLQPEWKNRKAILPIIVEYVLNNPKWKISLQMHKYIGMP